MPASKMEFKVLITSPGDVSAERDIVEEVILGWNRQHSDEVGAILTPLRWENVAFAPESVAEDLQAALTRALVTPCDAVLAVFASRLGTPTAKAPSGSAEEVLAALRAGKIVRVYTRQQEGIRPEDVPEYQRLMVFIAELRPYQIPVHSYKNTDQLKEKVARDLRAGIEHLTRRVAAVPAPIAAYSGRSEEYPEAHTVLGILNALEAGDRLVVVGRTCHRWFVGSSDAEAHQYRECIASAIRRGAHLEFVVQDLHYQIPLPESDILQRHVAETANSHAVIQGGLSAEEQLRLSLRYTHTPIFNSRVLLYGPGRSFKWLLYEVDPEYKPYAVIGNPEYARHAIEATEKIVRSAMSEEEYEYVRGRRADQVQLLSRVREVRDQHPGFLPQRRNAPERLVRQAAAWRMALGTMGRPELPSPLSVQVLLTHCCVTHCKMCDHYAMPAAGEAPLTLAELKALFQDVRDMGTRSVILSGGEPLRHGDIIAVLEHCSRLGLRVGVLTSGLSGYDDAAEPILNALAAHASWVQVSVDAFAEASYRAIRQHGSLDHCAAFVKGLKARAFDDVEVCCTVQQGNHEELQRPNSFEHIRKVFPQVNVRFKFAHGRWGRGGFLLTVEQVQALATAWTHPKLRGAHNTNASGLSGWILSQGGRAADVAAGAPAAEMLRELADRHPCYALRSILLIDANGDVYPCCHLFNDNLKSWPHRSDFRSGSWRKQHEIDPGSNALQSIWRGPQLQAHRAKKLPVLQEACERCTRHGEQNRFLAKLEGVFDEHLARVGSDQVGRLTDAFRGLDDPSDEASDGIWL